jgi:hypothetical protein
MDVPVSSASPSAVELHKIIDSFDKFFRATLPDETWPRRRKSREEEHSGVSCTTTTTLPAENEVTVN